MKPKLKFKLRLGTFKVTVENSYYYSHLGNRLTGYEIEVTDLSPRESEPGRFTRFFFSNEEEIGVDIPIYSSFIKELLQGTSTNGLKSPQFVNNSSLEGVPEGSELWEDYDMGMRNEEIRDFVLNLPGREKETQNDIWNLYRDINRHGRRRPSSWIEIRREKARQSNRMMGNPNGSDGWR